MPKKSANSRSGASRNRSRPQKSVQLVRPVSAENKSDVEQDEVETGGSVATTTAEPVSVAKKEDAKPVKSVVEAPAPSASKAVEESVAAPRSASARMAARRQAVQKAQTRQSVNLITAEHYAYVRKDLIFIAILAVLMVATLIVLHFVPAIGG